MNISNAKLVLFYLSVLWLPINVFRVLRPSWSYLDGVFIDYWAPSLYVSSFLIIGLWITRLTQLYQIRSGHNKLRPSVMAFFSLFFKTSYQWLVYGSLLSWIISFSLFSLRPQVSIIFLLEFLTGPGLLFIYFWNDRSFVQQHIAKATYTGLLLQAFLASYQFIFQSNLAPYWLLGEPTHQASSFLANSGWTWVVRSLPYGSTPHPNILGGWMILGILSVLSSKLPRGAKIGIAFWFSLVLVSTESITAMVSLIITMTWFRHKLTMIRISAFIKGLFRKTFYPIVATYLASLAWYAPIVFSEQTSPSIFRRAQLVKSVFSSWNDWLITGTGLLQHIALTKNANLPTFQGRFLQPVHSALGVLTIDLGLCSLFLLCVFLIFVHYSYSFSLVLMIGLLPVFSLDHYGITTIGGQYLLILLPLFLSDYLSDY